jgi:branched-chain amino acid transport system permease protein
MTIAGMGSVTGAMLAGLAVGMAQVYAEYYGFGGFEPAIPWILVVIVLLVRPEGLFGRSVR